MKKIFYSPFCSFTPHMAVGQGWAKSKSEARSAIPVSYTNSRGTTTCTIFHCFRRNISREWHYWDVTQCSHGMLTITGGGLNCCTTMPALNRGPLTNQFRWLTFQTTLICSAFCFLQKDLGHTIGAQSLYGNCLFRSLTDSILYHRLLDNSKIHLTDL